jgi:hypothetical protein
MHIYKVLSPLGQQLVALPVGDEVICRPIAFTPPRTGYHGQHLQTAISSLIKTSASYLALPCLEQTCIETAVDIYLLCNLLQLRRFIIVNICAPPLICRHLVGSLQGHRTAKCSLLPPECLQLQVGLHFSIFAAQNLLACVVEALLHLQ